MNRISALLMERLFMYSVYKLPRFMDYLFNHYHKLYTLYYGRLIELFPSTESTEANLSISDSDETSDVDNQQIYELWVEFK